MAMERPLKSAAAIAPMTVDLSNVEILNPDGIRPAYSNNAAILMNMHDLRLLFSEIVVTSPSDRKPHVELRASVTMSPTQFKAFAGAVSQTLTSFEKQFGEIKWPPKNQ